MRRRNVNIDIALTHIFTRKKQTMVAALGVMVGIATYLFMNSLSAGFTSYSRNEIFKNNAHIKIYKEDKISAPLLPESAATLPVIVNPQILPGTKALVNPHGLLNELKKASFITFAMAQVNADVFYHNGTAQLRGTANGVTIGDADKMFNISSYMIAGNLLDIQSNLNAIIIGQGIAEKLNVGLEDNITVSSSMGVVRTLRVKGIFSTGNSTTDQSRSYMNIHTAQQLLKESYSYVTTIYANTLDANQAPSYAAALQQLTDYKVESWQQTNADVLSGDNVRATLMQTISMSILIVAAFGIYNILNMTVMQKLDDIAILKATGFSGNDVVIIFVTEAIIMGLIGSIAGLMFGAVLVGAMANLYMGPPVGYFPVYFDATIFLSSFSLGMLVTFGAGYIPARKAARVDPVKIFRK
jgi:lipoprotein-releasing system permease protein